MTPYAVHFTDEAWESIQAQVRYVAIDNNAPENAARWLARLVETVDALQQMPGRHGLDEYQTQIHDIDVRRLIFERTYLLYYTIDEDHGRVNIVSFRHGAKESK